ncbi:MAG: hypothetical protein ACREBR_00505, partial [bacterium]
MRNARIALMVIFGEISQQIAGTQIVCGWQNNLPSMTAAFSIIWFDRAAGTQVGSAGLIRQKGVNRTGS